jgi:hypothetical protein
LFDWLDYQDGIYRKCQRLFKDAFLYGMCVAQVVYEEKYRTVTVPEQSPMYGPDGMPMADQMGQPMMQTKMVQKQIPVYRGASVRRVDPLNFRRDIP